MSSRLVVFFATHPVQYHAPVFRALAERRPNQFVVWYGSDFSLRGYRDREFATELAWDQPLLAGYRSEIVGDLASGGLAGPGTLRGRDFSPRLKARQVGAVVLTSLRYHFDFAAWFSALKARVPIWMRVETTDVAQRRSGLRSFVRARLYRHVYGSLVGAYPIGEHNRSHLRAYGSPSLVLQQSPYAVPDPFAGLSRDEKTARRMSFRATHGISPAARVVLFCGKFIEKKDPLCLLAALARLEAAPGGGGPETHAVFVGEGPLRPEIEAAAKKLASPTTLTGFLNQAELPAAYLASDVLVLPSRRQGETWGLVVNEALMAGCAVAVSDAVGCAVEFGHWARCRVFPEGEPAALTRALQDLLAFSRDFDWARRGMAAYSIEAAADGIAAAWPTEVSL